MNEQDVRALVREAIERHLGRPERSATAEQYDGPPTMTSSVIVHSTGREAGEHASHIFLRVLPGSAVDDGMCVIEPSVHCNHCGFCQSYGH